MPTVLLLVQLSNTITNATEYIVKTISIINPYKWFVSICLHHLAFLYKKLLLYFWSMKIDDNYPSTLPELAKRYKVTANTLYIWLRPIREELLGMYLKPQKRMRTLLPKQVKLIIEYLG